jgi:hypothetical protein
VGGKSKNQRRATRWPMCWASLLNPVCQVSGHQFMLRPFGTLDVPCSGELPGILVLSRPAVNMQHNYSYWSRYTLFCTHPTHCTRCNQCTHCRHCTSYRMNAVHTTVLIVHTVLSIGMSAQRTQLRLAMFDEVCRRLKFLYQRLTLIGIFPCCLLGTCQHRSPPALEDLDRDAVAERCCGAAPTVVDLVILDELSDLLTDVERQITPEMVAMFNGTHCGIAGRRNLPALAPLLLHLDVPDLMEGSDEEDSIDDHPVSASSSGHPVHEAWRPVHEAVFWSNISNPILKCHERRALQQTINSCSAEDTIKGRVQHCDDHSQRPPVSASSASHSLYRTSLSAYHSHLASTHEPSLDLQIQLDPFTLPDLIDGSRLSQEEKDLIESAVTACAVHYMSPPTTRMAVTAHPDSPASPRPQRPKRRRA